MTEENRLANQQALRDPFFHKCLQESAGNPEFVEQFDRLMGCNLSMRGPAINIEIDKATGRQREDLEKFITFVRETVYEKLKPPKESEET